MIVQPTGIELGAYKGCQNGSRFRWRDHWPTTMENVVGRDASGRQAAHGSFYHFLNIPMYEIQNGTITKVHLHGMTEKNVTELIPLAKSWLHAPVLRIQSKGIQNIGYDPLQRAYVLSRDIENAAKSLQFRIEASEESPIVNPAFVIKNWSESDFELELNGKKLECGVEYRVGHRNQLESTDLIVWVKYESQKQSEIVIKSTD